MFSVKQLCKLECLSVNDISVCLDDVCYCFLKKKNFNNWIFVGYWKIIGFEKTSDIYYDGNVMMIYLELSVFPVEKKTIEINLRNFLLQSEIEQNKETYRFLKAVDEYERNIIVQKMVGKKPEFVYVDDENILQFPVVFA